MRIFIDKSQHDEHWTACFQGHAEICFGGDSPETALGRLLHHYRLPGHDTAVIQAVEGDWSETRREYLIHSAER